MAFKLDNLQRNKEHQSSFNIQSILQKEISLGGSSFGNKKKEAFYTELHVLVKAGLTLKDALALIREEQTKEADKILLKTITTAFISGKNFSDAIAAQHHFSDYEFYSLQIGEKTGTLVKIFEELGLFYQRKNQQRRTIIGAVSYPIIVLLTALLAIGFMLKFVVPMFEKYF